MVAPILASSPGQTKGLLGLYYGHTEETPWKSSEGLLSSIF